MHSIGFYVFSNAIFDVHDCSKRFHGNQCSAGLPEHGSMHKWTDLVQRHPWFKGKIAPPALFCFSLQKAALVVFSLKKCPRHFRDSLSSVPLKIHFECCELLDSMNYWGYPKALPRCTAACLSHSVRGRVLTVVGYSNRYLKIETDLNQSWAHMIFVWERNKIK